MLKLNSIRRTIGTKIWIKSGIAAAALTVVGIASTPAFATTSVTTTFTVTATVASVCTIAANALPFGTYTGAASSVNTTISVTCNQTTPFNVGLNAGTATGATVTARKMTGPGGATLNYALYQNSSLTTNWGNTVGTDTFAGSTTGTTADSLTVYGTIPAGQSVTPGAYTDTITATVTY